MKAALPMNEAERLRALADYALLDTPPEQAFDDLTLLAAQVCGTPTALVTLIDRNRQWFKSRGGFAAQETGRDISFCAHTILQTGVMVVRDATKDFRFADNVLVTGEPHIRFYAGAPLVTAAGHALGSLAVIDYAPRELTAEQLAGLQALCRQAVAQLELREHRRKSRAALRASEARYRSLVESASDAILVADPQARLEDVNAAGCRMFGYARSELLGLGVADIVVPAELPRIVPEIARLKAGEVVRSEWRCRRKDGTLFPVEVGSTVLTDGRLLGILRDVSARQEAEAEARLLTQRLTLATDAAVIGVWDWDLVADRWYATPTYFTMLGYDPEEGFADRGRWIARLHPDDQPLVTAKIQALLAGGDVDYQYEARMCHADGGYRWIQVRGRVLAVDAKGRATRLIGVRIDISERKAAEQKLEESREQLRALLARLRRAREEERIRVSREIHDELGQLLTSLKMDVRWLERKLSLPGLPPVLNPLLDRAVAASELADATIATVQKIAAELRPGALDQLGLVAALTYEARRFQERSGVRCEVVAAGDWPLLPLEVAGEIFYICQEALTNVARHARATHVRIALHRAAHGVVAEIDDDGVGVSDLELHEPRSLGLTGMRERAGQCGGSVLFGKNQPRGTRVTVRVPLPAGAGEKTKS